MNDIFFGYDEYSFDTENAFCIDDEQYETHSNPKRFAFFSKENKINRSSNLSWTFTYNVFDINQADELIRNISSNSNKAYVILDNTTNTMFGYFSLKEKFNKFLLNNIIGKGPDYQMAAGGCHDNRNFLKSQVCNGIRVLLDMGYGDKKNDK